MRANADMRLASTRSVDDSGKVGASTDTTEARVAAAPLRRVVVASDFSDHARSAMLRAATLPLAKEAKILLLHVAASPGSRAAELLEQEERMLGQSAHGATIAARFVVGDPSREIIRAAREHGADLTIVGAHSRRGVVPGLGGVARSVVRRGSTPVLVVRARAERPYARPLVGLDLSDVSNLVLQTARSVVGAATPVAIVHAYHVPFEGYIATSSSKADLAAFQRHYRAEARRHLAAILVRVGAPSPRYEMTVRQGEPCTVIASEIARRSSDLVVVGTHGRTGVSRFFLGSVAQWMLENAPCDVLVGRAERFTTD